VESGRLLALAKLTKLQPRQPHDPIQRQQQTLLLPLGNTNAVASSHAGGLVGNRSGQDDRVLACR